MFKKEIRLRLTHTHTCAHTHTDTHKAKAFTPHFLSPQGSLQWVSYPEKFIPL